MGRREREVLEDAVPAVAEQAIKADQSWVKGVSLRAS